MLLIEKHQHQIKNIVARKNKANEGLNVINLIIFLDINPFQIWIFKTLKTCLMSRQDYISRTQVPNEYPSSAMYFELHKQERFSAEPSNLRSMLKLGCLCRHMNYHLASLPKLGATARCLGNIGHL